FIPMPQSLKDRGVMERDFYNSLASYKAELATIMFDPNKFADALDERVVTPLRKAQMIFDTQPYLTRLYTTVSPDEMTRDPLFHINPDLPTVSNLHRALGTGECSSDGTISNI